VSRRTYTDQQLATAVANSGTIADVLRALGLFPGGGNYESIRARIRELELDSSHLRKYRQNIWLAGYPEDDVRRAVQVSRSMAQVFVRLGEPWSSRKQAQLKRRLQDLGIQTSHFLGGAWRRGSRTPVVPARPLDEVLVVGRRVASNNLKHRLFQEGLKPRVCENCGLRQWRGRPISLELDHVNGRKDDNRLENLRILCPNCHAQTDTYRGRNIGTPRLGIL
jgi:5-methylcytosine-specific restriction endonuclease McrA